MCQPFYDTLLQNETIEAVEFLAELPRNRSKRTQMVTTAATRLCNLHSQAVSEIATNESTIGAEAYRNTYRIQHTANVLRESLGADIDTTTITSRMEMVRRGTVAMSKYAPLIGSYQRLHNASCAVKNGKPGAKADFYVASATFAVDATLAQYGVAYKASFAATGYTARKIGVMRLSRVCGYKCVALVESELHWVLRGGVYRSVDLMAQIYTNGNLSRLPDPTLKQIRTYLEQTNNMTILNDTYLTKAQITRCIENNFTLQKLYSNIISYGADIFSMIQTILKQGQLPSNADLSKLTELDQVKQCAS